MRIFLACLIIIFILLNNNQFSLAKESYLIDDFEDHNLSFNPEWFQFGSGKYPIVENNSGFFNKIKSAKLLHAIQKYSLRIKGKTDNWYLGGIGTYLGLDVKPYKAISMYIKGSGKKSGRLKIEIFDDDNNNWKIEQNPRNDFKPFFDDKFIYEINIDWKGWKKIEIPFTSFQDENKTVGDNIWNPIQEKDSGGLIQIQLIFLTSKNYKKAKINYQIDKIELK